MIRGKLHQLSVKSRVKIEKIAQANQTTRIFVSTKLES